MAVIQKQWENGDVLTLTTSAGGLSISSDQNLTGVMRQMTISIKTDVGNVYQNVVIKQYANLAPNIVLETGDKFIAENGYYLIKE